VERADQHQMREGDGRHAMGTGPAAQGGGDLGRQADQKGGGHIHAAIARDSG
jgi:hypothetical protein